MSSVESLERRSAATPHPDSRPTLRSETRSGSPDARRRRCARTASRRPPSPPGFFRLGAFKKGMMMKGRIFDWWRSFFDWWRRETNISSRHGVLSYTPPFSPGDDFDLHAVQKKGTSDDGDCSTPTIEDYESPPLPATESDDFHTSSIQYISSSEADPDDIDSDNPESKIERVVEQVSGTRRDDIVKRVRSIRIKYKIAWSAAAEKLFFRLIKTALKVQHSSEGEFKEHIENMLINWKDTLKYFLPNRFSEVEALNELGKACLKAKQSFPVFPTILSCLHEHNILSQRAIVFWAQDVGREYGPNENLVKESSEFIKALKEGLCNDVNRIPLYGSEDVYEGHGFDDQVDNSE